MFRILFCFLIVAMYAFNLNAQELTKIFGGKLSDEAKSIVRDTDGNIYVAGQFQDTMFLGNGVSIISNGDDDGFVAKFNSSGDCQWANSIGGESMDDISNMAIDKNGAVYVVGYFKYKMTLGVGISLTTLGNKDGFIAKYSNSGECQWAKKLGGNSDYDGANCVAVDDMGNACVVGYHRGYMPLDNNVYLNATNLDGYVIKYNSSGICQWAKSLGGKTDDQAYTIAIDIKSNIYVAGRYGGEIAFGNDISLKTSAFDTYITKLSIAGECQWAYGLGCVGSGYIHSMAIDSTDNIYLGGSFNGSLALNDSVKLISSKNTESFVAKYNVLGDCQWAKTLTSFNSLAVDSDANLFVSGNYTGTISIKNGVAIDLIRIRNAYIAKYDSIGDCKWAAELPCTTNDLAIDSNGNTYVAGYTYGALTISDGGILLEGGESNCCIIKSNSQSLIVPSLYFPEFGIQSMDINTHLNWYSIYNATGYKVQVSLESNFINPIVNQSVTSTTMQLKNLQYYTAYYWRVLCEINSDTSDWSSIGSFRTSYNPNANVWAQRLGSNLANRAACVAVDSNGSFYLAGTYYDNNYYLGNGNYLTACGKNDGYVAKYNSLGVCQFGISLGGNEHDDANSVATDKNGNIYVVGNYKDTMSLGNGIVLTSAGNYIGYIAKYNLYGTCIWARNLGDVYFNDANSVSVDAIGDIYVAGTYKDTLSLGSGVTLNATLGGSDGYIAKFNSTGLCQWAKSLGNDLSKDEAVSITVDASGNVYLSGDYVDAMTLSEDVSLIAAGKYDGYLAKYNSAGECLWAKSLGGENIDQAKSVSVDANSNAYVVGNFKDSISFGNDISLIGLGKTDAYVVKYNLAGECQWAKCIGGASYDEANSVSVDVSGNVFVVGVISDTVEFGNGLSLNGSRTGSGYIAKLNSFGKVQWVELLGTSNSKAFANSVTNDNAGNTYIAGYYSLTFDTGNKVYLYSIGAENLYVIKYKAQYTNPPALIAPVLASNNISINIPLTWNEINDVSGYRVQVSTSNDFTVPIVNEVVSTTSKNLSNLLYNTQYFWRVKALTTTDSTAWSPIWDFNTLDPANVEKSSNETFSISPQPVRNEAVVTFNVNTANNSVIPAHAGIYIELYDLKGTKVGTYNFTNLSEGTNKLRLDVSNIPSGMYNVIIKSGAEVHQAKMIKVD